MDVPDNSGSAGDTGGKAAPIKPSRSGESWWSEARAVFVKDVRSEMRTRAAVATILLFAVVTLIIVSFLAVTEGLGLTLSVVEDLGQVVRENAELFRQRVIPVSIVQQGVPEGTALRAKLLSALLWIILFFSAMAGLPRTFVKEEEMRTAAALRLAARASAVFVGKLCFNGVLVLAVAAVVLPLFLILFTPWIADWPSFLLHLVLGCLAIAGSATLLGAMVARAGGKSYLMLPLAFPVLLPVLVFNINGTAAAIHGIGGNQLVGLVSYLIAMVTLSAMLFDRVWNDA